MDKDTGNYLIGIDIGAGTGAKIGLFKDSSRQVDEIEVTWEELGNSCDSLAYGLVANIKDILDKNKIKQNKLSSVGVVSPGIFDSNGKYIVASNLSFLNEKNIRSTLESTLNVPVAIENDANAGGLAEWNTVRSELLYWVFGGGWGGVWISKEGNVLQPAVNWDKKDSSLHLTNEPGYATGLRKALLKKNFFESGFDYDIFEKLLKIDNNKDEITGPSGNKYFIRAEDILSGPGISRLYRSKTRTEEKEITGEVVYQRAMSKEADAIDTFKFFGKTLAIASHEIFMLPEISQRDSDGKVAVPVYIAGKPAEALPFFGPYAQQDLTAAGIYSYIQPSVVSQKGLNPNLIGAAVLAEKLNYKTIRGK